MPTSDKEWEINCWLEAYFEKASEARPNDHVSDVHTIEKNDVYKEYVDDMKKHNKKHLIVSDSTFFEHWSVVWSNFKVGRFNGITSHCDCCHEFHEIFKKTSDDYVKEKLKDAQTMHRSCMIYPERKKYIQKRYECEMQDPNEWKKMSFIIDMPKQSGCGVPYLGAKATFSSPLHQVVVGVKVHGKYHYYECKYSLFNLSSI
jgi:hypothetical protein